MKESGIELEHGGSVEHHQRGGKALFQDDVASKDEIYFSSW